MNGNHNPRVVPGYYNPQQTTTEISEYKSIVGEDFFDPTQIPMHPNDTVVPMQPPSLGNQRTETQAQPIQQTQNQQANYYQAKMRTIYTENQNESKRSSIEPIRIPIIIELTINLNINGSNI